MAKSEPLVVPVKARYIEGLFEYDPTIKAGAVVESWDAAGYGESISLVYVRNTLSQLRRNAAYAQAAGAFESAIAEPSRNGQATVPPIPPPSSPGPTVKARLRVVLLADGVTVAESEDVGLWRQIMVSIISDD